VAQITLPLLAASPLLAVIDPEDVALIPVLNEIKAVFLTLDEEAMTSWPVAPMPLRPVRNIKRPPVPVSLLPEAMETSLPVAPAPPQSVNAPAPEVEDLAFPAYNCTSGALGAKVLPLTNEIHPLVLPPESPVSTRTTPLESTLLPDWILMSPAPLDALESLVAKEMTPDVVDDEPEIKSTFPPSAVSDSPAFMSTCPPERPPPPAKLMASAVTLTPVSSLLPAESPTLMLISPPSSMAEDPVPKQSIPVLSNEVPVCITTGCSVPTVAMDNALVLVDGLDPLSNATSPP
jgi:hypothetical protein